MSQDEIEFGCRVRDEVGGFKGIVVSIAEHLTGCTRVGVVPDQTGSSKRGDEEFFYEAQLDVIEEDALEYEDPITDTDFSLGEEVTDDVTGFEGIIEVVTYNIYNCPRVGVQAIGPATDKTGDVEWFDAPRLSSTGEGVSADFESIESEPAPATGASRVDIVLPEDTG